MSCWHKLFRKRESVSKGVSVLVRIQSYYFAPGGLATELILYSKRNNLISLDNKHVLLSSSFLLIF